jgi:hypothetical protein
LATADTIQQSAQESSMATKAAIGKHVKDLSSKEAKAYFDRQARQHLHMTGPEFIRKWDRGQFNGSSDSPAVMRVAMLLPFGR